MGYFDFLIDKGQQPKDIEYIYMLDEAWDLGQNRCPIEYGTIVHHVKFKKDNIASSGYSFAVKNTGKKYFCNYGWAFAERTSENSAAIAIYLIAKKNAEDMAAVAKEKYSKIKTLHIPASEETEAGLCD